MALSSQFASLSRISLVLFKAAGLQPKIGAVLADLNTCERLLTQLTALVDCKPVYYNYVNATRGLCEGGLLGLVLMLAASFIAAILLTIMVGMILMRKRRRRNTIKFTRPLSFVSGLGRFAHLDLYPQKVTLIKSLSPLINSIINPHPPPPGTTTLKSRSPATCPTSTSRSSSNNRRSNKLRIIITPR